jgi:F-type H+-transporting ATPase subunit b
MLIDWFTVAAQTANFLILVWLLKRYLYKPILNAIAAREKRIADELADAAARKSEAQAEKDEYLRKNDEFDQQRTALQNKLVEETTAERKRLFEEARKDAERLRARHLETLEDELQALNAEIVRRTQAEAFAIARHALNDLAGASLEEQMVGVFVRRLREMDEAEKTALTAALAPSAPALVRSAFELSPAQRTLIEDAIRTTFAPAGLQMKFDIVPGLIGGIELVMQGRKIAWSVADRLESLNKEVGDLLKSQHRPGAVLKHDE